MYSSHVIIVNYKDNTVGYVPDALAQKLVPLLETSMIVFIWKRSSRESPETPSLKENGRLGGGVEIPCIYNLYGDKINKRYIRKEL